jgi:GntR family transcriptional regulator
MSHPLIQINAHSGVPIYRQIENQLRHHILSGMIGPGEALPSVRDLSAALKINPITISKAYALLERSKLLERRRGVGLFVAEKKESVFLEERRKTLQQIVTSFAKEATELKAEWSEVSSLLENEFQKKEQNIRGEKYGAK